MAQVVQEQLPLRDAADRAGPAFSAEVLVSAGGSVCVACKLTTGNAHAGRCAAQQDGDSAECSCLLAGEVIVFPGLSFWHVIIRARPSTVGSLILGIVLASVRASHVQFSLAVNMMASVSHVCFLFDELILL